MRRAWVIGRSSSWAVARRSWRVRKVRQFSSLKQSGMRNLRCKERLALSTRRTFFSRGNRFSYQTRFKYGSGLIFGAAVAWCSTKVIYADDEANEGATPSKEEKITEEIAPSKEEEKTEEVAPSKEEKKTEAVPSKEEKEAEAAEEGLWDRITNFFFNTFYSFANPKPDAWPTEDLPPPPLGKEYILIIAEDAIAKMEYMATGGGFITKKRPGVEYILSIADQNFELILFSMQTAAYGPTLDKLDPNRRCRIKLFRDSTSIVNGKEIKDLTLAKTDLAKLLVVDVDYANVSHKENTVLVTKYEGGNQDLGLVELDDFLRYLSWAQPEDLRPFIKVYQEMGPEYYRKKFRALQTMQQQKRHTEW